MRRKKIPVAVLGATGGVGRRMVQLLADHPWFEVTAVTASDRSAGLRYGTAVGGSLASWCPAEVAELELQRSEPGLEPVLVFSALDASVAGEIETGFAIHGHCVVSNARNHRLDPGVPLLVPEVNPDHLALLRVQKSGDGALVTNPNCSTIGLALVLKPLWDAFGIDSVSVVTLQAISGAGLTGVHALDIQDNVVPFIEGEEEKIRRELPKILGKLGGGNVEPASINVSAACNRVPVLDGHTECVSVALGTDAPIEEVREAWESFRGVPQHLKLPTAPDRPVHYAGTSHGPQPRSHRGLEGGMAVSVGRLRPDAVLDYQFVTVSHNMIRGAAGGSILCAELLVAGEHVPDCLTSAVPEVVPGT